MASSSTTAVVTTYQVFLSFRGPDTRQGFTDVLYHALVDAGIRVFRDNEEIRKGGEIGEEILRAIKESMIFVPVFSRGYASSKWCLVELTEMVKSKEGSHGKKILPVFYDVGVDDVKLKTQLYSQALEEHSKKFGSETVKQWEEALREAGKIKGWELKDTGYGEFVRAVVREVSMKLKVKHKLVTEYFVQRDYQMEALMKLLDLQSSDVRLVGIYGMGGMGKTTLAKAIFNELCDRFDLGSFLADVRESSRQHKGIECLQKQLLGSLGLGTWEIMDVDDGIRRMREMLVKKKVLIVLDDVDHKKQIHSLAGDASWFGSGSRIIITTRDHRVLEINHQRIQTLEVEEMKLEEARRLFCMHAFQMESPPNDYLGLTEEAVTSTGQLPLALEIIGSYLRDKPRKDWTETIERLKNVPHRDVQEKLVISYEALDHKAKHIFLDIACFFIDSEKTYPTYMWEACDLDPETVLVELISMSLVKIIVKEGDKGVRNEKFWMHDQLRDLGRKIVCDDSFKAGAEPSRLWMHEDALERLQEKEGKEYVEMFRLHDESSKGHTWTQRELSSLRKLRYLEYSAPVVSRGWKPPKLRWHKRPTLLPNLRWLSWDSQLPTFMITDLCLRNLVILNLSRCNIDENWSGWNQIGVANSLKALDLSWCCKLRKMPDLSSCSRLERLILSFCTKLRKIDPWIGKLKGLRYLDVSYCISLKGFPEELCSLYNLEVVRHSNSGGRSPKLAELNGGLTSLLICQVHNVQILKLAPSIGRLVRFRRLSLQGCSGLEILPNTLGDMKSLVELDLSGTDSAQLPQTVGRLVKLELLSVGSCEKMKKLPVSIGDLRSLVELDISYSGITELPDTMGNLENLRRIRMRKSNFKELPTSIAMLKRLEELDASDSDLLEGIPSTIKGLTCLRVLDLSNTRVSLLPPELPAGLIKLYISSPSLKRLPDFSNCRNLVRLSIANHRSESGKLRHLELQGMGKLCSLVELDLRNLIAIPQEFSSIPQLRKLTLWCANLQYCPPLPSSLSSLELVGLGERTKLPRLSNLKNLLTLEFRYCCMRDDTVQVLGVRELESLKSLSLFDCTIRNLDGLHLPTNACELRIR